MLSQIATTIHNLLIPRWTARFSGMSEEAREAASSGMTPEEAYMAGARNGYWDAIVDMVTAGLLKVPVGESFIGDTDTIH